TPIVENSNILRALLPSRLNEVERRTSLNNDEKFLMLFQKRSAIYLGCKTNAMILQRKMHENNFKDVNDLGNRPTMSSRLIS
ncbi:hypothetical protein Bhyg_11487, partial [Pseudolycoriella hygida]